eukprot:700990_1
MSMQLLSRAETRSSCTRTSTPVISFVYASYVSSCTGRASLAIMLPTRFFQDKAVFVHREDECCDGQECNDPNDQMVTVSAGDMKRILDTL